MNRQPIVIISSPRFAILLAMLLRALFSSAQVIISNDGSAPAPSAGLEVKFPDKGVLIPRMTFEQRNAMTNPPEGLIVFCTNCGLSGSGSLCILSNGTWTTLNPCLTQAPAAGNHVVGTNQIEWKWNTVAGATGYKWSPANVYGTAEDMGTATTRTETGTGCGATYARYVWTYDNCGISMPATLVQSIAPPCTPPLPDDSVSTAGSITWHWQPVAAAAGYKWNTTDDYGTATDMGLQTFITETNLACGTLYTRYVWAYNNCNISSSATLVQSTMEAPDMPAPGTPVATSNQVTWNWLEVPGATSYRWNTIPDFNTATDLGVATSHLEPGLTCNTPYSRYVWSCNNCGHSDPAILTATTLVNPPAPSTGYQFPLVAQITWIWNAVGEATGYRWSATDDFSTATDVGPATSQVETGLDCFTVYYRYIWSYNACGHSGSVTLEQRTNGFPLAPAQGNHVALSTQVTWNWNPSEGATGYKWNTANDYNTAQDLGPVTSKTDTGLACNTGYTRYLWAYSSCGGSPVSVLTQSTLAAPAAPATGTHVAGETQIAWNWLPVPDVIGYKWNTTDDYGSATDMGTLTTRTDTGLTCNTLYTRFVWSYSACDHSAAVSLQQSTTACWNCGMTLTDARDNQQYGTVLIGTQCWMAQNLNTGVRVNASVTHTNNSMIEKYCYYDSDANCDVYGGLYQWDEAMNYTGSSNANPGDRQGICPAGWHFASDAEWCQMELFLDATVNCSAYGHRGTDVGGKLKEAGYAHWVSPNAGATNASGFTGLPGGELINNSLFFNLHSYAYFWTTTESNSTSGIYRGLETNAATDDRMSNGKNYGMSIRCVKN